MVLFPVGMVAYCQVCGPFERAPAKCLLEGAGAQSLHIFTLARGDMLFQGPSQLGWNWQF